MCYSRTVGSSLEALDFRFPDPFVTNFSCFSYSKSWRSSFPVVEVSQDSPSPSNLSISDSERKSRMPSSRASASSYFKIMPDFISKQRKNTKVSFNDTEKNHPLFETYFNLLELVVCEVQLVQPWLFVSQQLVCIWHKDNHAIGNNVCVPLGLRRCHDCDTSINKKNFFWLIS